MRHGPSPPRRSPPRVSSTRSGWSSASSIAVRQPESTSTIPASMRPSACCSPGTRVLTQSTSARAPGGASRGCAGGANSSTTSRRPLDSPAWRRSIACAAASPPFTTTARSASPSADATAASAPGSISSRSTSGPTTPANSGELLAPGRGARAALRPRSSASARARQRAASASAERHASSAARNTASAPADVAGIRRRGRRDRVVELGELGAQHAGVGDQRLEHAFVGGRRELALDAAVLLGDERGEAAARSRSRLDPHQPVGERVVAHHA